jgi:hypothetical protein
LPGLAVLSLFVRNIVVYISGFVSDAVAKKTTCPSCVLALCGSETDETISLMQDYTLITEKNNGGLVLPSSDVVQVCKIAELEIRRAQSNGIQSITGSEVVKSISMRCNQPEIFTTLRLENSADHPLFSGHVLSLIRSVAKEYVKIRLHHMSKEASLANCPTTIRSKCTKVIHFSGN